MAFRYQRVYLIDKTFLRMCAVSRRVIFWGSLMLVVPGILSTCDPTNRAENKKGLGGNFT